MLHAKKTPKEIRAALEQSYMSLDIWSEVERHTSTKLYPMRSGKQANGACPFDDCPGDHDGFIVYPELSSRGCHFYCRNCQRKGDIIKLLREVNGWTFARACEALEIANPYIDATAPAPAQRPARWMVAPSAETPDLTWLDSHYQAARKLLQKHDRARAYLAERAIPFDVAIAYGLAYIPPLEEWAKVTDTDRRNSKWCDRVVFLLQTPDGKHGYIGRALALWHPGMDEYEHKEVLKSNGINRYEKTNPAGYFNWPALTRQEHAVFVEGLFDALALIAGGISNVVALAGTALPAKDVPKHLEHITVALDADQAGQSTGAKLYKDLYRAGYEVRKVRPEQGKDWSEVWRRCGAGSLTPLLAPIKELDQAAPSPAPAQPPDRMDTPPDQAAPVDLVAVELATCCAVCNLEISSEQDFFYTDAGVCYCAEHYQLFQSGDQRCVQCGDQALYVSPSGHLYCSQHYQCRRGHRPTWKQRADGYWICRCYFDYPGAPVEHWPDQNGHIVESKTIQITLSYEERRAAELDAWARRTHGITWRDYFARATKPGHAETRRDANLRA